MSVILRNGTFGEYYGNDFNSSNPLILEQMKVNALYIYSYLTSKNWSINAIAGLLGNMQVESSINPGRWQSDRVLGDSEGHGYGLVQWTPYTKYTEWVESDPSTMDNNLSRIIYEIENNIQWIPRLSFSSMTFKDFSTSNLSPSLLARAFMLCYERPLDQSEEAQVTRGAIGDFWYTYLTGIAPSPPSVLNNKKKKFKFILFKRRSLYGKR